MRLVVFVCRRCGHIFSPIKRVRSDYKTFRHQCSNCGARGRKLQKWSTQDLKIIIKYFQEQPYDLEDIRITQKVRELRPDKPEGAPKCWGTYDGSAHCKKKCYEIHGGEIQQSCILRKQWDDQWK